MLLASFKSSHNPTSELRRCVEIASHVTNNQLQAAMVAQAEVGALQSTLVKLGNSIRDRDSLKGSMYEAAQRAGEVFLQVRKSFKQRPVLCLFEHSLLAHNQTICGLQIERDDNCTPDNNHEMWTIHIFISS